MTSARRRRLLLLNALANLAVVLGLLVVGAALYGATLERPWLRYANLPFPVQGSVHAGEPLALRVVRCNDAQVARSYLVTHQLRNLASGTSVLLPDTIVEVAPGCTESLSRINVIPRETEPGRYVLAGRAELHGLFADHSVSWASAPFEVLPERSTP